MLRDQGRIAQVGDRGIRQVLLKLAVASSTSFAVSHAAAHVVSPATEVRFAVGSAQIDAKARADLLVLWAEQADKLTHNEVERVIVIAYTDSTGSKAANRRLAQSRAAAVTDYLKGIGVPPSLIESRAHGEVEFASNKSHVGRARNRIATVEILLTRAREIQSKKNCRETQKHNPRLACPTL